MADKKEIGINQRIPLHVLEAGLVAFLNGSYSSDYIAEQLRLAPVPQGAAGQQQHGGERASHQKYTPITAPSSKVVA